MARLQHGTTATEAILRCPHTQSLLEIPQERVIGRDRIFQRLHKPDRQLFAPRRTSLEHLTHRRARAPLRALEAESVPSLGANKTQFRRFLSPSRYL